MDKVIVIVGPTGVGKSKLGVELAKKLNGEIISGDSVQVYKRMDIGSAKVSEEEKEGITHHLIDIKEIEEDYSVYSNWLPQTTLVDFKAYSTEKDLMPVYNSFPYYFDVNSKEFVDFVTENQNNNPAGIKNYSSFADDGSYEGISSSLNKFLS